MLAQSILPAAELGITVPQRDALMKTLVLLETGKLKHANIGDGYFPQTGNFTGHFNMCHWNSLHPCGTVACLGGTAELVSGVTFGKDGTLFRENEALYRLFMPNIGESLWTGITPAQAATALRSYLTTGNAKWHEAVADQRKHERV